MVLSNLECWANGGGGSGRCVDALLVGDTGNVGATRRVDLFDPQAVQQTFTGTGGMSGAMGEGAILEGSATAAAAIGAAAVSHIVSNGYYGFSYLQEGNNNNINDGNNNNNLACTNNNNSTHNLTSANNGYVGVSTTNAIPAIATASGVARCKKRFYVDDDNTHNNTMLYAGGRTDAIDIDMDCTGGDVAASSMPTAAKRCRIDDGYAAAEYCNDFFSLPSTQIGTQSCIMDTEDLGGQQQMQQQQYLQHHHARAGIRQPPQQHQQNQPQMQQQVQLDHMQQQNHQLQQQQQQTQQHLQQPNAEQHRQQQQQQQQEQEQQQPPQQLYQIEQHYQGHLHRANRDVNRCMVSHMI